MKGTKYKNEVSKKIFIQVGKRKWRVPSWVTAHIVGVTPDAVNKIRKGDRTNESDNGQLVEVVDQLLPERGNLLIQEIERIVKIDK